MSLDACLPANLRGPSTAITRVASGLSGAGVYRVEAAGQAFVLKVSGDGEPLATWRRKAQTQQLAATAGLAPRVIHVDETKRAIVSAFVADRSLPAMYADPRTREATLKQLGRIVRRVHELPLPPGAPVSNPREYLNTLWSACATGTFTVPKFVADSIRGMLAEEPPACDRPTVLSHNDVNPTNLAFDGEQVYLLDWDTAGPNDPLYDLATLAVFFRMDDATCLRLLAAHDGAPASELPPRFRYDLRIVAALCGTAFLNMAREGGHAGAAGETLDTTPSLSEIYRQMRSGAISIATAEGQWRFGLALATERRS